MVSIAPFFTAILAHFLQRDKERIPLRFFLGFAIAITGIVMISLNGNSFELNPKGDILALAAALLWAVYSIITKEIGKAGDSIIRVTRHIFFYGILFIHIVVLLIVIRTPAPPSCPPPARTRACARGSCSRDYIPCRHRRAFHET